jgi:hypothetical protein
MPCYGADSSNIDCVRVPPMQLGHISNDRPLKFDAPERGLKPDLTQSLSESLKYSQSFDPPSTPMRFRIARVGVDTAAVSGQHELHPPAFSERLSFHCVDKFAIDLQLLTEPHLALDLVFFSAYPALVLVFFWVSWHH